MRKVTIALMITSLFMAFVFFSTVYAGEVINNVCPIMGGEVDKDTSYKIEYEGETIGFCCPGCIGKFKADPEKYMAKIQKARKKCIIKCPECGAEIDMMEQCKKGAMKDTCPMMKKAE